MKALKLLLASAGVLVATSAFAQVGEPMYTYTWYSDASYTTQVGGARASCTNRGVTYRSYGTRTVYEQQELAAYCVDGRPEPA